MAENLNIRAILQKIPGPDGVLSYLSSQEEDKFEAVLQYGIDIAEAKISKQNVTDANVAATIIKTEIEEQIKSISEDLGVKSLEAKLPLEEIVVEIIQELAKQ